MCILDGEPCETTCPDGFTKCGNVCYGGTVRLCNGTCMEDQHAPCLEEDPPCLTGQIACKGDPDKCLDETIYHQCSDGTCKGIEEPCMDGTCPESKWNCKCGLNEYLEPRDQSVCVANTTLCNMCLNPRDEYYCPTIRQCISKSKTCKTGPEADNQSGATRNYFTAIILLFTSISLYF